MKKVNVHIVTYNSAAFIKACIESVRQQSYPIQQVVIIDNDSRDKTLSVLNELDQTGMMIVANKENVGFAAGHNQAIQMAVPSDYYLILNPDVVMHPDYVYTLIQSFEENTGIGSATGQLLFKQSPEEVDSTGLRMTRARRAFDRGAGESKDLWSVSEDVFGVSGAAGLYSAEMVRDISIDGCFFDEDFFAYKEDVDVAWRARLFGWKAMYVSEAIAYHDRGWKKGSRGKMPLRIRRFSYINRYKMILKNDSMKFIFKHLHVVLFYEILSFIYFLLKEPKVLGAWKQFCEQYADTVRKRKIIQSKRKADFKQIYDYFH